MPEPAPNLFEMGIRMIFSLLVVAALIFMGYFLIKNLRARGIKLRKDTSLSVISCLPIGPKRYIYLVKIADCVLVLGVTGERITLLHRIEITPHNAEMLGIGKGESFMEMDKT